MSARVGIGFDVHPLARGHKLVLGGVDIASETGLVGHSDADVLSHAIIDALLGAAALGDIGSHFPDDDPEYCGISSIVMLQRVRDLLRRNGWQIENVDATIIAERPRIRPYVENICLKISQALSIDPGQVGVKATTNEGLGFIGRGSGFAAHAVALLKKE